MAMQRCESCQCDYQLDDRCPNCGGLQHVFNRGVRTKPHWPYVARSQAARFLEQSPLLTNVREAFEAGFLEGLYYQADKDS